MKEVLKKIFVGCKAVSPGNTTPEPLTCGTDEDYKREADLIAANMAANNPNAAANAAANAGANAG